ncbi:hypothetical protein D3C74_381290 [compost metagenome]
MGQSDFGNEFFAVKPGNLRWRNDIDLGCHQVLHTVLMCAEFIPAVYQGNLLSNRFKHQCPIHGRVAAAADQHLFAFERIKIADEIVQIGFLETRCFGQLQTAGFKSAYACGNDHGFAVIFRFIGSNDEMAFVLFF